jgi:hypothetical protein
MLSVPVDLFMSRCKNVQSGFRSNHSCQTALINIIDKWIEEMNNGNVSVVILLDLEKAFDVDHDIMAKKLEIYETLLHFLICLDKYRCLLFC